MTKYDVRYLAAITPGAIELYLDSTGWTRGDTVGPFISYNRETLSLDVPQEQSYRDYGTVMSMLIGELARIEGRSSYQLVSDIIRMGAKDE